MYKSMKVRTVSDELENMSENLFDIKDAIDDPEGHSVREIRSIIREMLDFIDHLPPLSLASREEAANAEFNTMKTIRELNTHFSEMLDRADYTDNLGAMKDQLPRGWRILTRFVNALAYQVEDMVEVDREDLSA